MNPKGKNIEILKWILENPINRNEPGSYWDRVGKRFGTSALAAKALFFRHKASLNMSDTHKLKTGKTLLKKEVKATVKELREQHYIIESDESSVRIGKSLSPSRPTKIDTSKFNKIPYKFGVISDTHYASKYCREDVAEALYDIWNTQGITTVYHCGNIVEGDSKFNIHDVIVRGIQAQVDYLLERYPQRKNIKTYFITGDDHEGWWIQREGINIGEYIQDRAVHEKRDDLMYLGHMEHDIILRSAKGKAILRLTHPGGGSAYALSFAPQKYVESLQAGLKPNIIIFGHWHKAEYNYAREVHMLQAGAVQDQSPFMRKKRLQSHVGGWTVEFTQDDIGVIHGFKIEWHSFYDKEFYKKHWKYYFGQKSG